MFILPRGIWKDNIRSLILDWRQRSSGHSDEGERSASLSSEERDPLAIQADLSAPGACSPAIAQLHKKGPSHRRKICVNSFWLYSYDIQSSPSKNKHTNYIFIDLRVFGLFFPEVQNMKDRVRRVIHLELCKKFKFDHTAKWYNEYFKYILVTAIFSKEIALLCRSSLLEMIFIACRSLFLTTVRQITEYLGISYQQVLRTR